MESSEQSLKKCLRTLFDSQVVSEKSLAGGSINRVSLLKLSCGSQVVLKRSCGNYPGMFAREAEGLNFITCADGPRVPRALAHGRDGEGGYLLLEYLPSGRQVGNFWGEFGRALAYLHLSGRDQSFFGLPEDNYIGSTHQPNRPTQSWRTFFAEQRLGYQLELAQSRGVIDSSTARLVEAAIRRLDTFLDEPVPSAVHGDLWSGNMMVGPDGCAAIFDPAAHYAHGEVDLAMSELFGRFDDRFYGSYREIIPIEPGYEMRVKIYNLYHMLNHLNLFGHSYLSSVRELASAICA